ncbi:MAG: transglutaminase domain-containing protein [Planctomycetota bacterium]
MLPATLHVSFLCVLSILASQATTLRAAPGDVQATFDAPCRYPAGMATDGTNLYIADWREAKVYMLDPTNGTAICLWDAPALKPRGMAWGAGGLYVSDDHTGFVYRVNVQSGTVENSFQAPGSRATGLAYVDGTLFILERKSQKIYRVEPEDGTILGYFAVPDSACECMTYDGKYLWIANRIKDELYMVSPQDGTVLGIIAAPGPYAAGLAWHDNHLWNIDFQTRKLYQLGIHDTTPYRLSDARTERVEYAWILYNYGPGEIRDLSVSMAIPEKLPSQQLLSEPVFSTEPAKHVTDRWDQPCVVFEQPAVPAGEKIMLGYHVNASISAVRYLIDPARTGTLDDIPADIRAAYTIDGSRYGVSSPFIQETAKRIVGDEQNPYWIARKIFNHIIETLEYEMVGGWDIPEVVLRRGSGSCSEYTFCFVALCRAAGLPARYQGSVVIRGDDASIDESFHRWAQVYLPNYGWVPVDANKGDARSPADQARGFGELANRFLITTQGGGDSEYLRWSYNSHVRYGATGYCKIEEENLGFWEPLEPTEPPK